MALRNMMMQKNDEGIASKIGHALGASRVVALPGLPISGPLDLMQLRSDVAHRLKSSGGRPTDPELDVQRLVRFRRARWKQLEKLAGQISTEERKVSPGQVAAILIDQILGGMEKNLQPR